jgi:hypothetical protein
MVAHIILPANPSFYMYYHIKSCNCNQHADTSSLITYDGLKLWKLYYFLPSCHDSN